MAGCRLLCLLGVETVQSGLSSWLSNYHQHEMNFAHGTQLLQDKILRAATRL